MWEQLENQFLQKQKRKDLKKEDNKQWKSQIRKEKCSKGKKWQIKQQEQKNSNWPTRPLSTEKKKTPIQIISPSASFQSICQVLQSHKKRIKFRTADLLTYDRITNSVIQQNLFRISSKGRERESIRFLFQNVNDLEKIGKVSMIDDAPQHKNNEFRYIFRIHLKEEAKCTYLVVWITERGSTSFQVIQREFGEEFFNQLHLDKYLIPEAVIQNSELFERIETYSSIKYVSSDPSLVRNRSYHKKSTPFGFEYCYGVPSTVTYTSLIERRGLVNI